MKVTGINPIIVTADAAPVLEVFDALGLQKTHVKTDAKSLNHPKKMENMRYKDEKGNHADVSQVEDYSLPRDLVALRINVDNFAEAYDILQGKGFTNPSGEATTVSSSDRSALMVSPSGYPILLVQHVRDEHLTTEGYEFF